ncbi:E3 ubiquitin-protein ligase RBBP6-like [Chironomus tepperi]|uniref:E3 ubiquitin-protein ligase RBBP6-like n=1 Tax=Chironomus tepperi TaxID=113505 RepID=UPI00391F5CD7
MNCIRYKFKSENSFSQILFTGTNISVADIKKEIYSQRKLGRSENVDLMISNLSNSDKYTEDTDLVPKNTSVIVMRVPAANPSGKTKKFIKNYNQEVPTAPINTTNTFAPISTVKSAAPLKPATNKTSAPVFQDLTTMKGTEEEKIFAMMMQSTFEYTAYQVQPQCRFSAPPRGYVCRKCHVPGHFVRHCTFVVNKPVRYDPKAPKAPRQESKKMTGIPMSLRNKTESQQQINIQKVESYQIPQNLYCSICKDIFRNPVTMPCCKTIYCHECAVIQLVESDDSNCPKCDEKFIYPGMLKEDIEMRMNVEKAQKVNGSCFINYGRNNGMSSRMA